MDPVFSNLWNIWEGVEVELTSFKDNLCVQISGGVLSPSVFAESISRLVSGHGISPGSVLFNTTGGSGLNPEITFFVLGEDLGDGIPSIDLAVVGGLFVVSGSSNFVYLFAGGFPEGAEALLGEVVAGVGGGTLLVSSWEEVSLGGLAVSFGHGVGNSVWSNTGGESIVTSNWVVVDVGSSEGVKGGDGIVVNEVNVVGSSAVLSGGLSACDDVVPVEGWLGGSVSSSGGVGRSGTVWESSGEVSLPLLVGLVLEESPEVLLGLVDFSVFTIWASVDWSSSGKDLLEVGVVPAGFEEKDDDHDVEDGESNKAETEHLSSSESGDETSVDGRAAGEGNSGVGVDSNSHTNVTGKDGGH